MSNPSVAVKPKRGRGGKRPGAGRPKSKGVLAAKKLEVAKENLDAAREILGPTTDPVPTLEELEALALQTLQQIMKSSPQDGPRVSAAKAVKEWVEKGRERAAEAAGMTGKKAQAQAAAEQHTASGGKFAPPPAAHRFQ